MVEKKAWSSSGHRIKVIGHVDVIEHYLMARNRIGVGEGIGILEDLHMVFNTQGGLVVVRLLVIPDICHILTRIRWRILFQSLVLVVHDCSHNPGRL